jgi:hypothetical protein
MVEKLDERDKCNDRDVGLSFGGVLGSLERVLVLGSLGGASGLFGGVFGVLESFKVDTDIKKPPVDVVLSSSLLLSGSDMYLAMSSRISSGDRIYCDMSSAVSKASSSSTTGSEGGLEVIV